MELIKTESNIENFLVYRNSIVRITKNKELFGVWPGINQEEIKKYELDTLLSYNNDAFLRASKGYSSILLFDDPEKPPIFENLYNSQYSRDRNIGIGLAAVGMDDTVPPLVLAEADDRRKKFIFDPYTGKTGDEFVVSKAMIDNFTYRFDWGGGVDKSYLSAKDGDGRDVWRKEFEGVFKIGLTEDREGVLELLGEFNDLLWVALRSGKILGIEYPTGKVFHEIGLDEKNVPERLKMSDPEVWCIPGSRCLELDRKRGIIWGLSDGGIYTCIDLNLNDPLRKLVDCEKSMTEFGLNGLSRYCRDDQHIYFSGNGDRDVNLGIFDRKCERIIWSDVVKSATPDRGHIKKLIVRDNRLYVLDFKNFLYTFELDSVAL